jgi:hypothetical protein
VHLHAARGGVPAPPPQALRIAVLIPGVDNGSGGCATTLGMLFLKAPWCSSPACSLTAALFGVWVADEPAGRVWMD